MASARTNFNAVGVREDLTVDQQIKLKGRTATAASGAASASSQLVKVTSENLTTAAGGTYTLTLTNSYISPNSALFANAYLGSSTQGTPQVVGATPGNGQATVVVRNIHASAAFNGSINIDVLVVNPA